MIKAQTLISLLEGQLDLLRTLRDGEQPIGGFAIICPPDSEPITFVNISSQDDAMSFYQYLSEKLKASRVENGPAIRTGR